jgi:hypothetical protein
MDAQQVFHLGISDRIAEAGVRRESFASRIGDGPQRVQMVTVDDFVEKHNLSLGFIKADVEGHAFALVKGAAKSLVRYRPVFTLFCYHDFVEMYHLSIFLMNLLPNYHFEWHSENYIEYIFYELSFAGYPREALE